MAPPSPIVSGHDAKPRWYLGAVLLGIYALLLVLRLGAVAGAADQSGYFNHARLLSTGHLHAPYRSLPGLPPDESRPYLYVPLGLKPAPDGHGMVPAYPSGLSLIIAACARVTGWANAGNTALLLHALAGIILTNALARLFGLGRRAAFLGAALIAASPIYIFMSLQTMSDVPAMAWTTAAVIAAWKSREDSRWALGSGFVLSIAILIRPSNALAFAPIAACLGASPRRWLGLALGGLPGAAFFFLHSHATYGSWILTGYGDPRSMFDLSYIPGTLGHYALWLPALFTPIVVLSPGIFAVGRKAPRAALVLGIWIAVYAGFFSFYVCTSQTWWYLRFLLPAAPALVVASLLVARPIAKKLTASWPKNRIQLAFAAALTACLANGLVLGFRLHAFDSGRGEQKYRDVAGWLNRTLPADSPVLAMQVSGSLYYFTGFPIVRYDMMGSAGAQKVQKAVRQSGHSLYAVLFPFEENEALRRQMPGAWRPIGRVEDVTVWQLGD